MRNYAEKLAYWYFRLNGFFVLENYVLEKRRDKNKRRWDDTFGLGIFLASNSIAKKAFVVGKVNDYELLWRIR